MSPATIKRPMVCAHYWWLYPRTLAAACEHAATLGYEGLDLAMTDRGLGVRFDLTALADRPEVAQGIAAAGREWGLTFTDFVVGAVDGTGMTATLRGQARRLFARVAPRLGVAGISGVTLAPGEHRSAERKAAFKRLAGELRTYVQIGSDHGLAVSIEPHVGSVTDSPERTLHVLEHVPGLKLTLDYSHFISAGFDQRSIEPLHPFARHVHVRQAKPGFLSVEVANGSIDLERMLLGLKNTGYEGALTTEYVKSPWQGQDRVNADVENEIMRVELVNIRDRVWGRSDA